MTLLPLIAGLAIFLAMHVFTSLRGRREAAIARFGMLPYRLAYSVVAVLGLALIVWGFAHYRANGYIPVWDPPRGMSHLAALLMVPAFILLAATYLPGEIKRRFRHPMITAVKIWALAHLLANGDLGSILLFGGFLAWGVMARISMKHREEEMPGAPAAGDRQGLGFRDGLAVGIGLTLYVIFIFWGHRALIGVPVFGG